MNDVSLIILNYNSANDTLFCVNKLLSFQSDFHIIIVDNKSTDESYGEIMNTIGSSPYVDLIQATSNRGYSAGNNLGIKYAIQKYGSSIVGILNPDVIIPNFEVLTHMKKALESSPQFAIVGGATVNADNEYNPNLSSWNIPSSKEVILNHFLINNRKTKARNIKMIGNKIAQVECVAGCFFLAKADILQLIGFLDESVFLYNEENILGIKCKRAGYKEIVVMDQFYIHNHKHRKKEKMPFIKKIMSTKNSYMSRKYLCKTYYSKKLLPLLWLVEMLNRFYLMLCYIRNLI